MVIACFPSIVLIVHITACMDTSLSTQAFLGYAVKVFVSWAGT